MTRNNKENYTVKVYNAEHIDELRPFIVEIKHFNDYNTALSHAYDVVQSSMTLGFDVKIDRNQGKNHHIIKVIIAKKMDPAIENGEKLGEKSGGTDGELTKKVEFLKKWGDSLPLLGVKNQIIELKNSFFD